MDEEDAWGTGWHAYFNGYTIEMQPYDDSEQAAEWIKGWKSAKEIEDCWKHVA